MKKKKTKISKGIVQSYNGRHGVIMDNKLKRDVLFHWTGVKGYPKELDKNDIVLYNVYKDVFNPKALIAINIRKENNN